MLENLSQIIEDAIMQCGSQLYDEPIIKVAGIDNRYIKELKKIGHSGHLQPEDLLEGAKSVFAYFLPFKKNIVDSNRAGRNASRLWAKAYVDTNYLLAEIADKMSDYLKGQGINSYWTKPTHNFDSKQLVSFWSHKHVAFACGLGSFGTNGLLITDKGCAGRIGSIITNWDPGILAEDAHKKERYYRCPENCSYCIKVCPVGALNKDSLNKKECYNVLLENSKIYEDLGLCDVCGKCSTGPCGYIA